MADVTVHHTNWQSGDHDPRPAPQPNYHQEAGGDVTVVTNGDTLSAVVCLEEGLADDDSWVEDLSHDEDDRVTTSPTDTDSGDEVTLSSSMDREEELRGYHRSAIDFTLHTILEESCEESEAEQSIRKVRPISASELEKYFFFGLGDGQHGNNDNEDVISETSSICSEGVDSLPGNEDCNGNESRDPAELASSRLEKYFLTGFMGFAQERRDSDGSGSVGSDSEGRPSPEQRRKRLVRARGTGRSHSSSLDNLLASADLTTTEQQPETQLDSGESSTETDTYDDLGNYEKSDSQSDTVKRKKQNKKSRNSPAEEKRFSMELRDELNDETRSVSEGEEDGHKTPQPEFLPLASDLANSKRQTSRDSGFIGSSDDLLKNGNDNSNSNEWSTNRTSELKIDLEEIVEENKTDLEEKYDAPVTANVLANSLIRKDSFNNWSSDEETNLMMNKMRQFFKSMVAASANAQNMHNVPNSNTSSKPTTPTLNRPVPSPRGRRGTKPPQLVYFENELTRLMKTVPGIRDEEVREIVEYLSSEDTWSDSYDSSDYTSSDLEGAGGKKSALQQQISDSCKEIISNFDKNASGEAIAEEEKVADDDNNSGFNKDTAFVYQKLVASLNKMNTTEQDKKINDMASPHSSPPLFAKVMHHIGSRLVALMHEVSSGESHASVSPKVRYHKRLQHKVSSASTTEDDESTADMPLMERLDDSVTYGLLPRSKSHDLLLGENARNTLHQSGGVSDITEEREASDYERFSWRGSFESALMAADSRNKLSLLGAEGSVSASALAAKRRSAGDLLFQQKSPSREQLDRVRSCGSIGGAASEERLWVGGARGPRRRSSVPDSGDSADGEDDEERRPRGATGSLPRLPTVSSTSSGTPTGSYVKSARYRPPGFTRAQRAVSAPGLHARRDRRRAPPVPSSSTVPINDDSCTSDISAAPRANASRRSASPTPPLTPLSPLQPRESDEDIDRLVALHHNKSGLQTRSESMASVYSGAGDGNYGSVTVKGQVEFGLLYNYKIGALEVNVKRCRDLAIGDTKRNRTDPYVKVYLLPDKTKSGKRKTKHKKNTLRPVFDETFRFVQPIDALGGRSLWLSVWNFDTFGRNNFLGEVILSLENRVFDDPTPRWYNLQERTEQFEEQQGSKGDMIVGLKFEVLEQSGVPNARSKGVLHVLVKEAKNLCATKSNVLCDVFCKSYLLPERGRSVKQKTPVIRKTLSPRWEHCFMYKDVSLSELQQRALELSIWDRDRLSSNDFMGGIRFSLGTGVYLGAPVQWMDSVGKEVSLWQTMMQRPNFWVEGSVPLRPSLSN